MARSVGDLHQNSEPSSVEPLSDLLAAWGRLYLVGVFHFLLGTIAVEGDCSDVRPYSVTVGHSALYSAVEEMASDVPETVGRAEEHGEEGQYHV